MKKLLVLFMSVGGLFANGDILDDGRIANIALWGKEGTYKLGELFVLLQSEYFAMLFLSILIATPIIFALHYMVIGPMRFAHGGEKIQAFNLFMRVIHWIAAASWIILLPTGVILVFAKYFGGGEFVKFAKNLHGIGTIMFAIVVIPMLIGWIKDMFPKLADVKWMMIVGGYLSKEKKPIPAYKYNFGQKVWFWISVLGGFLMIFTGAQMYFLDMDILGLSALTGIAQIDMLRISAIVHNIFAMIAIAMFITHVYMSVFAIKGSIHSMIYGYKEEEEVKILHSLWYKKLKNA